MGPVLWNAWRDVGRATSPAAGIPSRCGTTRQAFVEEVKKAGPQLLLSALLTTTVVAQEATIETLTLKEPSRWARNW